MVPGKEPYEIVMYFDEGEGESNEVKLDNENGSGNSEEEMPDDLDMVDIMNMVNVIEVITIVMEDTKEKPPQ
ncbi:unnamed protein product [Rhizophagus irregularis]|nr:unnamed protein product [Rhizophagus irregularis]